MLEEIFLNQQLGSLGLTNFLRHAIHWAVLNGYSLEFLVLILLLPLAATSIAIFRYLIGIQGLGLFPPIMLAVVFLSTGIVPGLVLFLFILLVEILMMLLLRKLKIHFMAKMALVLLIVCPAFFLLFFFLGSLKPQALFNSALIPLLILILLGENLAEVQLRKTFKRGIKAMFETLVLATVGFFVLNPFALRKIIILYPEAMILLVALVDIWLGHFSGLRLLEYRRFKRLFKKS